MNEEAPRLYTVEDANALLAELVPLLERLRDAHAVMEERHDEVMDLVKGNGGGSAGKEFLEASSAASEALARLGELEIAVRDPATGLVDFRSERDGEPVWLCWRLGEDRVAHWHPIDRGFADRRPLP